MPETKNSKWIGVIPAERFFIFPSLICDARLIQLQAFWVSFGFIGHLKSAARCSTSGRPPGSEPRLGSKPLYLGFDRSLELVRGHICSNLWKAELSLGGKYVGQSFSRLYAASIRTSDRALHGRHGLDRQCAEGGVPHSARDRTRSYVDTPARRRPSRR